MGAVTLITSGKGGVGKSSMSVGIAVALAKKGRRVILVDCDAGLRCLDKLTGTEEVLLYDISDVANGRCQLRNAIYESSRFPGVFMIPAAQSGDDLVEPEIMSKITAELARYYDHVILDSPAGIGRGFKSACSGAQRAVLVCNPDPVSVRSCCTTARMLDELGISKQRLIINRFNGKNFRKLNTINDLDQVIDEAGVRLLGIVPEDFDFISTLFGTGKNKNYTKAQLALYRIAARLEGERVPINLKL